MTSVEAEHAQLRCPFDHHSQRFAQDLYGVFEEARAVGPLVWSEEHGGYWITTTWEMTRRLAIDSETFTVGPAPDRVGGILIPTPPGAEHRPRFVPGEADGEEHDHYRLALNPHFSKQRITELQPVIERHVSAVLDDVVRAGDFDIAYDLVAPILSGITCEIMGMQVAEPRRFFDAQLHLVSHGTEDPEKKKEFDEAWSYIVSVVADRRAEPRDDVITALTQYQPAFTDDQIHMMIMNVNLGANDTTKSLMAQSLIYLDKNPKARQYLAANPDQIRGAIEEFLRLMPVATGPCRTAAKDVVIDGVHIRKGDRLMLGFSGANHDPAKYPNPHDFDLERGAPQHLGMGVGAHFCLGAWLAKAISATTMRELLARCPNFFVDHDDVQLSENRSSLTATPKAPAHVGPGAR